MLGLLFFGAVGVSAIKAGIDNAQCMSKPKYKTERGYNVYMDRTGKEYINGKWVYDYPGKDQYGNYCTVLRDKNGNIYSSTADRETLRQREFDKKSYESSKAIAEKFGHGNYFTYEKYFPEYRKRLSVENTTGRPVGRIKYDLTAYGKGIKYYKYYYHDGLKYHWDESDKVEITKEEYDAIWD
jgi:hypothetical protein